MIEGHAAIVQRASGHWGVEPSEAITAIRDLAGHTEYERALEVGAGREAAGFAVTGLARHILVAASSPARIKNLWQLAVNRELPQFSVTLATPDRLPCADSSFDLVVCRVAAHHFHDARPALDEVVRVLRPGGVFILADAASPDEDWLSLERDDKGVKSGPPAAAHSPAAWCRLLEEHGLVVDATVTTRTAVDINGRDGRTTRMADAPDPSATLAVAALPRVGIVSGTRDSELNRSPWHGVTIRASQH